MIFAYFQVPFLLNIFHSHDFWGCVLLVVGVFVLQNFSSFIHSIYARFSSVYLENLFTFYSDVCGLSLIVCFRRMQRDVRSRVCIDFEKSSQYMVMFMVNINLILWNSFSFTINYKFSINNFKHYFAEKCFTWKLNQARKEHSHLWRYFKLKINKIFH